MACSQTASVGGSAKIYGTSSLWDTHDCDVVGQSARNGADQSDNKETECYPLTVLTFLPLGSTTTLHVHHEHVTELEKKKGLRQEIK